MEPRFDNVLAEAPSSPQNDEERHALELQQEFPDLASAFRDLNVDGYVASTDLPVLFAAVGLGISDAELWEALTVLFGPPSADGAVLYLTFPHCVTLLKKLCQSLPGQLILADRKTERVVPRFCRKYFRSCYHSYLRHWRRRERKQIPGVSSWTLLLTILLTFLLACSAVAGASIASAWFAYTNKLDSTLLQEAILFRQLASEILSVGDNAQHTAMSSAVGLLRDSFQQLTFPLTLSLFHGYCEQTATSTSSLVSSFYLAALKADLESSTTMLALLTSSFTVLAANLSSVVRLADEWNNAILAPNSALHIGTWGAGFLELLTADTALQAVLSVPEVARLVSERSLLGSMQT
eukprot:RCo037969